MVDFARVMPGGTLEDGPLEAGPIEGANWSNILPGTRFWTAVQAFVAAGGVIEPAPATGPSAPPVPTSVTPLQARRALLAAGLLDDVEALLESAPREAQLAWEYAIEVRRDDPTLAALAGQMGLSAEALDQLFVAAAGM